MEATDDPLASARATLDDTLASLTSEAASEPAMIMSARNAIVALGGMARFGAPPLEMARAVERTGAAVRAHLEKDPGDALGYPLLDARATSLAEVVQSCIDLSNLDADDTQSWTEEAFELFSARDAADAWLLGAAALLRWFSPGDERTHLERARERAVVAIARFDYALDPALDGLSPLRDAAKTAVMRAKADKGYVRRAHYWKRIIDG